MDDKTLVEPSNDEQSQWPEATEAYVRGLEERSEAQATRIEALEAVLREIANDECQDPWNKAKQALENSDEL